MAANGAHVNADPCHLTVPDSQAASCPFTTLVNENPLCETQVILKLSTSPFLPGDKNICQSPRFYVPLHHPVSLPLTPESKMQLSPERGFTALSRTHLAPMLWPVSPDDRLTRHFWGHRLLLALRWLALFVVLLPFFAPFVDQYYAHRDPHHAHIYLGGVQLDHHHPAPTSLAASTGDADMATISGAFSVPSGGIAAAERAGNLVLRSVALLLSLAGLLFLTDRAFCRAYRLERLLPHDELFLPPPDKPPRPANGISAVSLSFPIRHE